MNRIFIIWTFLMATASYGQEKEGFLRGETRFEMGYPHAGSYSKERPILGVIQGFSYHFNSKFSSGIETGFVLYPGAFTIPVHAIGSYHFKWWDQYFSWNHRVGVNTKLGQNSFFNYRYQTDLRYSMYVSALPIQTFVSLGGAFMWDRWGGKALNGVFNIGMAYKL